MNKENIKRANELEKEITKLEELIPYIDGCLNKSVDGFNEIQIVLSSSSYSTKHIQKFVPQLMPAIAIIAKDEIRKQIREKEAEIATL